MPKIKKSRREKKLADQRKKTTVAVAKQPIPVEEKIDTTIKSVKPEQSESTRATTPASTISTSGYNYLFTDLTKTAILTSSIIIAEIVIKQLTINN